MNGKCEICDKEHCIDLLPTSYSGSLACKECRDTLDKWKLLIKAGLRELSKGMHGKKAKRN